MQTGVDYIGVCVVYFCHDGQGNVIMGKRTDSARDEHGRWDIGGGKVEFGDSVEGTIRKEIKEEYNVDVLKFEFLGFRDVKRQHKGKITHWIALDFKVLVDPSTLNNNEPHKFEVIKFFPINALPIPTHSQFPEFLRKYKARL